MKKHSQYEVLKNAIDAALEDIGLRSVQVNKARWSREVLAKALANRLEDSVLVAIEPLTRYRKFKPE